HLVQVEITSEDPAYPIESALTFADSSGWRAAQPGVQTIRILFDEPQEIQRIRLQFDENTQGRTQEFVLCWSTDGGKSYREILRQQYTFSPPETVCEIEDYAVDLHGVTVLELRIAPDINKGNILASLSKLQLA
ncbi:MAG TPA: hypothetical protein VMW10_10190, partial [Alphaproteobacteria bacterium]|nr:hypothetical protein [Alphaproteobacteria bacterium]